MNVRTCNIGKLSNRKAVMYIFVQLLASIVGMALVASMFDDNLEAPNVSGGLQAAYVNCTVQPPENPSLG